MVKEPGEVENIDEEWDEEDEELEEALRILEEENFFNDVKGG